MFDKQNNIELIYIPNEIFNYCGLKGPPITVIGTKANLNNSKGFLKSNGFVTIQRAHRYCRQNISPTTVGHLSLNTADR